jgi:hypothetical protein
MDPIEEPEFLLPFEWMQTGDSFFIPTLKPAQMLYIIDLRAKAAKMKVKAYTSTADGVLGVRVWKL